MGHSAGGHLALLYAYKAAAGHTINGNPMHPISLVISEAGPIQFASKTVYNENEVEYGYVFADDNVCAMAGITMPNTTDLPEVYNEKLAILAAVSPYCIAQDIEDKSTLPYTILVYGHGLISDVNSYIGNYGDGTVPIQPALDLYSLLSNEGITTAHISENSGCYSSPNGNFTLYYFYGIAHGDFSGVVHPDTETYESRKPSDCFHLATNTLCNACKNRYATLDIERIESYYTKLKEKLNPSGSN